VLSANTGGWKSNGVVQLPEGSEGGKKTIAGGREAKKKLKDIETFIFRSLVFLLERDYC